MDRQLLQWKQIEILQDDARPKKNQTMQQHQGSSEKHVRTTLDFAEEILKMYSVIVSSSINQLLQ